MAEGVFANQRPANLRRDELPTWAREALDELHRADAAGEGCVAPGDPARWDVAERSLSFWSRPSRRGLLWVAGSLLLPIGFGLLVWALLALRTERVLVAAWGAGGVLLVAGAASVSLVRRWLRQRGPNGLLIVPAGLIVLDGADHRIATRDDIHDVVLENGRLITVYGPDRRSWSHYAAAPGTSHHAGLEERHRAMRDWRGTGAVPVPELRGEPRRPLRGWVAPTATLIGVAAALLGFGWLTLVMPARSDGGRVSRRFVAHIAERDLDAAYALLSESKRSELSRADFEAQLPDALRSAEGLTVNRVAVGVGMVVGAETCVDGWLDGVSGTPSYVFEISGDGDAARLVAYRDGTCSNR